MIPAKYTTYSKYLAAFAEKEERRIRRELAAAIYKAFKQRRMIVTVSHDQANETEREARSANGFCKLVFTDEDHANASGHVWAFAYPARTAWKGGSPAHWVRFQVANVADLITDYSVDAESIVAPVNRQAEKYD